MDGHFSWVQHLGQNWPDLNELMSVLEFMYVFAPISQHTHTPGSFLNAEFGFLFISYEALLLIGFFSEQCSFVHVSEANTSWWVHAPEWLRDRLRFQVKSSAIDPQRTGRRGLRLSVCSSTLPWMTYNLSEVLNLFVPQFPYQKILFPLDYWKRATWFTFSKLTES